MKNGNLWIFFLLSFLSISGIDGACFKYLPALVLPAGSFYSKLKTDKENESEIHSSYNASPEATNKIQKSIAPIDAKIKILPPYVEGVATSITLSDGPYILISKQFETDVIKNELYTEGFLKHETHHLINQDSKRASELKIATILGNGALGVGCARLLVPSKINAARFIVNCVAQGVIYFSAQEVQKSMRESLNIEAEVEADRYAFSKLSSPRKEAFKTRLKELEKSQDLSHDICWQKRMRALDKS